MSEPQSSLLLRKQLAGKRKDINLIIIFFFCIKTRIKFP